MNQTVRERWVQALHSGEFKQAQGYLRVDDGTTSGYCCLGVLCELYRRAHPGLAEWVDPVAAGVDGRRSLRFAVEQPDSRVVDRYMLPRPVIDWAGLPSSNPQVNGVELSKWNDGDEYGSSDRQPLNFGAIAQLIGSSL